MSNSLLKLVMASLLALRTEETATGGLSMWNILPDLNIGALQIFVSRSLLQLSCANSRILLTRVCNAILMRARNCVCKPFGSVACYASVARAEGMLNVAGPDERFVSTRLKGVLLVNR